MHRQQIAATMAALAGITAMTGGGLMAAGWAPLGGPRSPADAGALPVATAPAVGTRSRQPSPPLSVRSPRGLPATKVVPVGAGLDGGLRLPPLPDAAGWWALGAAPGSAQGTVLIAGHVDTRRGLAAFSALHGLALGSPVEITGANRQLYRYRITARRTYPRAHLPADLFSSEGVHRLALITCAGRYDRGNGGYKENLVLYGVLDDES